MTSDQAASRRAEQPQADAAAADTAVVRCVGLARTYGTGPAAVVAVHQAVCEVLPGEQIALTGPSGSGKSTLLHLMAGLESPTSGSISWPSLGGHPRGRPGVVGVVFQGPSLLPVLDVVENVALPLVLGGAAESVARQRALEALRRLRIDDLGPKLPEELSGGQAQRVAVARVLAARPSLILADEPTGQLDHEAGERVVSVLLEAAHELNAALIISTHDEAIAARLPLRWSMHDGRLNAAARDGRPGRSAGREAERGSSAAGSSAAGTGSAGQNGSHS